MERNPDASRYSARPLAPLGFLLLGLAAPAAAPAQGPGDPPPPACSGAFEAVADATVVELDPAGSYGTGPIVVQGNAGGERIGLVSFAPGPGFPRDATVYQARLEMTLFELAVAAGDAATIAATEEAWSEPTVTWNSRPAPLPGTATMPLDRAPGEVVAADVTTLFRRWQQGAAASFDLIVSLPQPGQASFFEHGVVGQPPGPRLVVSCAPVSEPLPIDPTTGDVAQQAGIELLQSLSTGPVELRIERGAVRFASFDVPVPASVGRNRDAQAQWFLDQFSGLLRTPAAEDQWQLVRREPSVGAVYFRQLHQGIPVFPSELALFFADGSVRTAKSLGGNYVPDLAVPGEPRLPAHEAEQLALALAPGATVAGAGPPAIFGDSLLVFLNAGLLGGDDPATYLTWQVQVARNGEPAALFIDAHTGTLRHVRALAQDAFDLEIKDRTGAGPINWPCWQTGSRAPLHGGGSGRRQPAGRGDRCVRSCQRCRQLLAYGAGPRLLRRPGAAGPDAPRHRLFAPEPERQLLADLRGLRFLQPVRAARHPGPRVHPRRRRLHQQPRIRIPVRRAQRELRRHLRPGGRRRRLAGRRGPAERSAAQHERSAAGRAAGPDAPGAHRGGRRQRRRPHQQRHPEQGGLSP